MAISNQIQRLTTLRNNIRTKLINLGILPAASTSATLSECYNVLSSVTGLGASSYTPTTVSQVIPSGRYLSGAQTINAIPSAYIIPSGTVVLSSSGTFDVGSYASADVTVTGGPSRPYVENTYSSYAVNAKGEHSYIREHAFVNISVYFDSVSKISYIGAYGLCGATVHLEDPQDELLSCSIISAYAMNNTRIVRKTSTGNTYSEVDYNTFFSRIRSIGTDGFGYSNLYASYRDWGGSVEFPVCSIIGSYAFRNAYNMRFVSFPVLNSIPAYGFAEVKWLSGIYAPICYSIGSSAFSNTSSYWSEAVFPNVEYVGEKAFWTIDIQTISFDILSKITAIHAFAWNPSLARIYMPNLVSIRADYVFASCPVLPKIDFPELTTIRGGSNFGSCTSLSSVSLPALTIISGASTFIYCSSLRAIDFPELTDMIGGGTFYMCSSLSSVSLPALTTISGGYHFYSCSSLSSVYLPEYTYTNTTPNMFEKCTALSVVSIPRTSKLSGTHMFRSCYNLISIFLLGSSVCALGNTIASMFASTPISTYSTSAGRWGSVFVPASLLAQYKAATNWTTISSKIFAYEDYFDSNGDPL